MNNTVQMPMKVLSYSGGNFKDDTGREVVFSNAVISFGGREIKCKSEAELTSFVEKDVIATVRISPKGSGETPQAPILTIVSVKVDK